MSHRDFETLLGNLLRLDTNLRVVTASLADLGGRVGVSAAVYTLRKSVATEAAQTSAGLAKDKRVIGHGA
jgi:hypothetical protein